MLKVAELLHFSLRCVMRHTTHQMHISIRRNSHAMHGAKLIFIHIVVVIVKHRLLLLHIFNSISWAPFLLCLSWLGDRTTTDIYRTPLHNAYGVVCAMCRTLRTVFHRTHWAKENLAKKKANIVFIECSVNPSLYTLHAMLCKL